MVSSNLNKCAEAASAEGELVWGVVSGRQTAENWLSSGRGVQLYARAPIDGLDSRCPFSPVIEYDRVVLHLVEDV